MNLTHILIHANDQGHIVVGGEVAETMIRDLEVHGLGVVHADHTGYRVGHIVLNGAGRQAADEAKAVSVR